MADLPLYVTVFLEAAVSISLNASIVVMNVIGMKSGLKLCPSDLIHVTMGVINVIMRGLILVQSIGYWISSLYIESSFYVMIVLIPFQMYFTYWLTAWLCAYYCVTITNGSLRLCVWGKRCLSTFLPRLLILSGAGSLVISLLSIWSISSRSIAQDPGNNTDTTTAITHVKYSSLSYTILIILLGCGFPFLIIISSLMVTVSSLVRHIWNMQKMDSGFTLQSYINAIRTMILFLILSVLFGIAGVILLAGNINVIHTESFFSWYTILLFPTAEAIIIIQASSKLRKMFLQRLCARCMMEEG